jgi:riboflavin synthase alpha subunit
MTGRIERWERYGRVKVTRDKKGRFIHWEKLISVVSELMQGKAVAVYGTCRTKYGTKSRRYEFVGGTGRELYECIAWAIHHPPSARESTMPRRK